VVIIFKIFSLRLIEKYKLKGAKDPKPMITVDFENKMSKTDEDDGTKLEYIPDKNSNFTKKFKT
jgi:hypothetical protein